MRFKLTLLLLLLNVALFCTLFYMDKSADSERQFAEENSLVLPPGSLEQASSLELDGAGAPAHWLVEKKGSDWQMVRPLQWPVNSYAVQNILDQLRFLRMETRFPVADIEKSGMTLADYGLDNPSVVLKIGDGKKTMLLRIGAPTKIGAKLYVLSPDGGSVFVTGRDILRALLVPVDDLRDSRIFTIPTYMASSLSLQRADGARVRLTKLGIGWAFESPIRADADDDAVESLLADMTALKVAAFVAADPAGQGLLSPRLRVSEEADDRRQSLLLGSDAGENLIFAKLESSPEVFTIDSSIVRRFQQAQEALRQRRFSRLNKPALTEIRIASGGHVAVLQKLETGEWQVLRQGESEGVQTWKADPGIVSALVDGIDALHAIRFASDAPSEADLDAFGLKTPSREIVLSTAKNSIELSFGASDDKLGGIYVKSAATPFVYEVSADISSLLNPSTLFFRSRELQSLPPAAKLTSVSLTRIADGVTVAAISAGEGKTIEETIAASGDNAEPLAVLAAFARSGRARDYI
ncbi:MAG TPA: DUF4340 domain-containing protein, partial [Opitutales bacterium]|nr:DUF4340 domain-containing protein [Opitutales bacterium]